MVATADPVEHIPPPETVRQMLAESVRRTELLRSILRVSKRKAAYDTKAKTPSGIAAEAAARGFKIVTADQLPHAGEEAGRG